MKYFFFTIALCIVLVLPHSGNAESSNFILLSSTIGPINSGIVSVLEDQFEKETGIRVRHVGAGTGAALDMAGKDKYGSPLFFPNSKEWKDAHRVKK